MVSRLALAPWLSWELSCAFLSPLRSLLATVPAQVLSSARCCPFLLRAGSFSENGARLPSCNTCIHLPRLAQVGAAYGGLSIQHRRSQIQKRPWPMAHLAGAQH